MHYRVMAGGYGTPIFKTLEEANFVAAEIADLFNEFVEVRACHAAVTHIAVGMTDAAKRKPCK